jgi:hypothetical protein
LPSLFQSLADRVALVDSTKQRNPRPSSGADTELLKGAVKSDTNQKALKRRHLEHIAQAKTVDRGTGAPSSSCRIQWDRTYCDARWRKVGERLGIEMSGSSTKVETI